MYRFALRPRWVLTHLVVVCVVAAFAVAGLWQLDRLSQRREHNALVESRRAMPETSISRLIDAPEESLHRRVSARGRFDVDREVVLLGRSHEGRPGNHVLTPLELGGGRAVVVDRGWVPTRVDRPGSEEALPPPGEVVVTGVVLRSESGAPLIRTREDGELPNAVSRVDVERLSAALPYRIFPHYLVLQDQAPVQLGELPVPVSLPELGEGSHLVYAVQWFLFIPVALIGYGAILRREARKASPNAAGRANAMLH